MSFLLRCAQTIQRDFPSDPSDACIVLPGRRPVLFLKKHLADVYQKPILSPTFLSIEEFLSELSGIQSCDKMTQLFELYEVHREIEKEEAETFYDFSKWAPVLLQDFNEIDQYLVEQKKLFQYVNEARAMEVWAPDRKSGKLTDVEMDYLKFWSKLNNYYFTFKERLEKKKIGYQGMISRHCAEKMPSIVMGDKLSQWKKFYFIGFNALNKAEESILYTLLKNKNCEVLWDFDKYYFDDPIQEAGYFPRKNIKNLKIDQPNWILDSIKTSKKKIEILSVTGDVSQSMLAGKILSEINSTEDFLNTAVVLADESLLFPLLESLPESIKATNISMGFPLSASSFHAFFSDVFSLHDNKRNSRKNNNSKVYYYHKDVMKILSNPILIHRETEDLKQWISEKNKVFISLSDLQNQSFFNESTFLKLLFSPWNSDGNEALQQFIAIADYLLYSKSIGTSNPVDLETMSKMKKVFIEIKNLLPTYSFLNEVRTIRQLFTRLIAKETLDFIGEPLKGLQVLGMLETRTLDFKNIILLSANEDVLPSSSKQNSFIPNDIRKETDFSLPTIHEKNALSAYYFYRLLHCTENMWLVYNPDSSGLSSGEKSRFISQMLNELPKYNPHIEIKTENYSLPLPEFTGKETEIKNTEDSIEMLKERIKKGLSPSAINTFINCPLDFYFKTVLKLSDEEEIEENIEASSLGTSIHEILQKNYATALNRVLTLADIEQFKANIKSDVHTYFTVYDEKNRRKVVYEESDLFSGKNLITTRVIEKFLEQFYALEKEELESLKDSNSYLTLLSLELEMEKTISTDKDISLRVKGTADRIDRIGNQVRIIDYKTGSVDENKLKYESVSDLFTNPDYSKALQLEIYHWLSETSFPDSDIKPSLLSFRKLSNGYMQIKSDKVNNQKEKFALLEEELKKLAGILLDSSFVFKHRQGSEYCKFCK